MFDPKSRYFRVTPYLVKDSRGRTVTVIPPPDPPDQALLGIHALRQGERVDHLASKYLSDPAGSWRIWEQNRAMLPESLTETREIEIPVKKSTS